MRSTSGKHFVALDHTRALAAFMVFSWHFLHFVDGYPVPFEYTPSFPPLAFFNEGHTGVGLFMVLSGYLFAKLLDGERINFVYFFWNRLLRLLPLLIFVLIAGGVQKYLKGENLDAYVTNIWQGVLLPTLPNGGWSITAELHFYVLLPFLLYLIAKSLLFPLVLVAISITLRAYLYLDQGEVQVLAYFTIIGRIDQFILGIVSFHLSKKFRQQNWLVILLALTFSFFWWWFDSSGGFYRQSTYPSKSWLWIVIPTIEAIGYASFIAWYDSRKINSATLWSKLLQKLGEYSYSIYLLHFFVVFRAARFINEHVMNISNFYLAMVWSALLFSLMLIPAYLSFRFIEAPFLKFRKNYHQ